MGSNVKCPSCKSEELSYGDISIPDSVERDVKCLNCGTEWKDIYLYSHYDQIILGDPHKAKLSIDQISAENQILHETNAQLEKAMSIIAKSNGDDSRELVYMALTEVGYYEKEEEEDSNE